MFLECQGGSRISKGRYLGEKEALVLYILEQFIMPGRSRSLGVPMALHSWVQASITLKILGRERCFGRKRSLYAYLFVSAAASKGHASMTLRCLYYTCLLTAIGQDTNYILAWVFPWPIL